MVQISDEMKNVLQGLNPSWPTDLKIRFLYVKLAPFFKRDLKYFLASEEERYQYYLQDLAGIDPFGTCKKICEFYHSLFKEYDIISKVVQTNYKKIPHFALIVKGETGWIFIDPLKDLLNNQVHMRSNFFGTVSFEKNPRLLKEHPYIKNLSPEYIREMDAFLGLMFDENIYFDEKVDKHHITYTTNRAANFLIESGFPLSIPDNNSCELFMAKIWSIRNVLLGQDVIIPGAYERAQFLVYLLHHIFTRTERNNTYLSLTQNGGVFLERTLKDGSILHFKEDDSQQKRLVLSRCMPASNNKNLQ